MNEQLISQIWSTFNHDTPESFWDVAVWQENGWNPGSLDVADRKRIIEGFIKYVAEHTDG